MPDDLQRPVGVFVGRTPIGSPAKLRHRILGIDPGSRTTGYGVIDTDGEPDLVEDGQVRLPGGRLARVDRGVDEVELGCAVDHDGDAGSCLLVRSQCAQRRTIHGGIGDHNVVDRLRQPQGLSQGVREHSLVAGHGEHRVEDPARTYRLARDADRNTAGSPEQIVSVATQCRDAERDDGSRTIVGCGSEGTPIRRSIIPGIAGRTSTNVGGGEIECHTRSV